MPLNCDISSKCGRGRFSRKNHFLLALPDLSKQRTSLKSKLASTYILLTNNLIKNLNGCLKLTENGPAHPPMMEMIYGFSMNWISITFGNDLWLPSISNDLTKSDQQNQISAVTKFALTWIGLALLASMVFPLYIGHLSKRHPCSYLLFTELKESHLIKTQDEWHWPFCQWALSGSSDGIVFLQVHIVKCHIRN